MFIQIHTLTGYSGVLLNRDDTGLAKRLPYGDAVRTRTSSQFAKRKIRLADGEHAISDLGGISVRSRETFRREIALPLIAEGFDGDTVVAVTVQVMDAVFPLGPSGTTARKKLETSIGRGEADRLELLNRGEINILSRSEIEYLRDVVRGFLGDDAPEKAAEKALKEKEFKDNLKQVGQAMSIDVAMFGRMTTGDSLSTIDAAVHVAHAMTTHAQATEMDFFTAVDDLTSADGEKGGGHMGEAELTSPMLYGYYVVDVRQLLSNLQGVDNGSEVAAKMVEKLVHLVAERIVGAKKGGTAPYSTADLVFVEVGRYQPRSLAEAFRRKVDPTLEAAASALERYLDGKDAMYGRRNERAVAASVPVGPAFGERRTLPELATFAATGIGEG